MGAFAAGETMFGRIAAGDSVRIAGPGEITDIVTATLMWCGLPIPVQFSVQAARHGCADAMNIRLEGVGGKLWAYRRIVARPAQPARLPDGVSPVTAPAFTPALRYVRVTDH